MRITVVESTTRWSSRAVRADGAVNGEDYRESLGLDVCQVSKSPQN
jgi:hypothetical protein